MHHAPNQTLVTVLVVIALLPFLYRRLSRMAKPQPLKLERLWIRPALLVAVAALVLFLPQPGQHVAAHITPQQWAGLAVAAALGGLAGWYWGRTMAIEVHPENGTLMTKGSIAAILVLVVLIAVKLGLRPLLDAEGGAMHLDVLLITDASIVFSVALFSVRSLEMFLRAKRVMADRGA